MRGTVGGSAIGMGDGRDCRRRERNPMEWQRNRFGGGDGGGSGASLDVERGENVVGERFETVDDEPY